jgi:hypothetical protein
VPARVAPTGALQRGHQMRKMAERRLAVRAPSGKDRADVIPDLRDTILNTWRTSNRVTVYLVEQLPPELWAAAVPGAPRRTIRMIAGHLHNVRCMWIRTLGQELGSGCLGASTGGGSGAGSWYRLCNGAVGASSDSSRSAVNRAAGSRWPRLTPGAIFRST